jgi:hypothetical protein
MPGSLYERQVAESSPRTLSGLETANLLALDSGISNESVPGENLKNVLS